MANYALTAISFLAVFIVCIPIPWHWRARNIATLSTIFWLVVGNLSHAINTMVWADNVLPYAPVYCDISLSLFTASAMGLPAAALCITRHLESVSSPRYSVTGLDDKRKRRYFELFMCLVLPLIYSAIHLIVQGHRFDIIEELGCVPTTYVSWPAIFLYYLPPIVCSIISSVYAAFALRWFLQRRAQFRDILTASRSGLTTARYFRLMGLALAEMILVFAFSLYILACVFRDGSIRPWVNWQFVHDDFKRIDSFPKVLIPEAFWNRLIAAWSLIPVSSLCFFVFFAFGEEAMAEYLRLWHWVRATIFRRPVGVNHHPNMSLPSYVSRTDASTSKAGDMSMTSRMSDIESKWDGTDVGSIMDSRFDVEELKEDSPYSTFDAPCPLPAHNAHRDSTQIVVSLSRRSSIEISPSPPPSVYTRDDGRHGQGF